MRFTCIAVPDNEGIAATAIVPQTLCQWRTNWGSGYGVHNDPPRRWAVSGYRRFSHRGAGRGRVGVLSDINLQAKLEEKLGLEGYPEYRILGACNPPLAEQGLDAERDLGTLLPCNVVVYEADDGDVVVSAVDPQTLLGVVDNPDLDGIAGDVRDRFDRVLDDVAAEY